MSTELKCSECECTVLERKIIGAEMETVCSNCGFYDDTQKFRVKEENVDAD